MGKPEGGAGLAINGLQITTCKQMFAQMVYETIYFIMNRALTLKQATVNAVTINKKEQKFEKGGILIQG